MTALCTKFLKVVDVFIPLTHRSVHRHLTLEFATLGSAPWLVAMTADALGSPVKSCKMFFSLGMHLGKDGLYPITDLSSILIPFLRFQLSTGVLLSHHQLPEVFPPHRTSGYHPSYSALWHLNASWPEQKISFHNIFSVNRNLHDKISACSKSSS